MNTMWDGKVSRYRDNPDWSTAVEATEAGIKSLVNDWLKNKSKCCPSVTVTRVDQDGKTTSTTYTKPIP